MKEYKYPSMSLFLKILVGIMVGGLYGIVVLIVVAALMYNEFSIGLLLGLFCFVAFTVALGFGVYYHSLNYKPSISIGNGRIIIRKLKRSTEYSCSDVYGVKIKRKQDPFMKASGRIFEYLFNSNRTKEEAFMDTKPYIQVFATIKEKDKVINTRILYAPYFQELEIDLVELSKEHGWVVKYL